MSKINKCLLCGVEGTPETLHNLPMFRCIHCDLVWRQDFDMQISHYEKKEVDFTSEKTKSRLHNSHERIKLFKKYVDFNNTCDIGSAEGIFLQALNESGYKNVIGLEPSGTISEYIQSHNLIIIKGTIENATEILMDKNIHTLTMFHLIEHLHNPLQSIQSLYNFLPKKGILIVETPNVNCFSFKSSKYQHKLVYKEHLFYFSEKSLHKLLKKCGFTIVARGKRDFDIDHMAIQELLIRLGIRRRNVECETTPKVSHRTHKNIEEISTNNFLKDIFRRVLIKFVKILGREDYIWVIAQKQ